MLDRCNNEDGDYNYWSVSDTFPTNYDGIVDGISSSCSPLNLLIIIVLLVEFTEPNCQGNTFVVIHLNNNDPCSYGPAGSDCQSENSAMSGLI